jgi:hypothetical protein
MGMSFSFVLLSYKHKRCQFRTHPAEPLAKSLIFAFPDNPCIPQYGMLEVGICKPHASE